MAVAAHKLGPGVLKFGDVGSEQEFASAVTRVELNPTWSEGETIPVLDGTKLIEEGEFEGTISGEFLQEYSLTGLVAWTWENHGQELPFVYRPRNDADLEFTGTAKIAAVKVGGDVNTRNRAEFEWKLVDMPDFRDATAPGV